MSDLIVVKAKIKEVVEGYQISADYADALDGAVRELIKKSIERAEANHRRTVMAKDI
ncbi:DUF1931 domain-containing protein [Candidatus Woesearchaeota archaeon]|nr:DUF1931 domain-containing protein [Candidatus Woesearchaeota archaeon]